MKATGIVRKVDELGKVVIPKELRRTLDIQENETSLEIYTEGSSIIFKKYERGCVFCGEAKETTKFKGKHICKTCLKDLK